MSMNMWAEVNWPAVGSSNVTLSLCLDSPGGDETWVISSQQFSRNYSIFFIYIILPVFGEATAVGEASDELQQ